MNLEVLARASRLQLGRHGLFQDISLEASTFLSALESRSYSRAEIESVFRDATPCGRVYGAWLLRAIDPEAGQAALELLASTCDRVVLEVPGSCGRLDTTTGKCAEWLLAITGSGIPPGYPSWVEFTEVERKQIEALRRVHRTEHTQSMMERITSIAEMNVLTEEMVSREMAEGGIICPYCGAQDEHQVHLEVAPRWSHVVCVQCSGWFSEDGT